MEEKQQIILANQDGGTVTGTAPTFFVILKQPGNGKTDQGILVTNRDACTLASRASSPGKSKGKICLPADCTVGRITVTLDNNSMWNEFHNRSTEMILTKQGRRMFPYCRYWITGLDSNLKYILVMDISPVDNHRYKWNGRWWEPSGKAEPHVLGRVFIHPESPSTGHYWMHQPVSFYKLKLTNNTLDQEGHIILHSMHRYLPRLHLVPAEKATEVIQLNGPGVHTFTFPQTEFFAVTAYQNIQITQLKIDYNPFAKGFRDDGLNSKPQRDGKQKNSSDQEGNSVPSSPGHRVRLSEGEGSEIQPVDFDPMSRGHETSGKGLEKTPFTVKQDFLGLMDSDSALEVPHLKEEIPESLVANNFEDESRIASPLDPNGNFNVVIKEEPLDDYDYEFGDCPEGLTVKQEETDEETDVYSNSDDDPILEKQLKRHNKIDNLEADYLSSKWLPNSPSGAAKAKMFNLDTGKMPVVCLEPCAVTKSTVKVSELPDNMLSTSRKDKSSMLAELEYLPTYIENSSGPGVCLDKESENGFRKHSPDLRVLQKYPLLKDPQWKYPDIFDSISSERILDTSKSSSGDPFSGKEDVGKKRTTMLKITAASKTVNANQNASSNVSGKRGRPRKLKFSKSGRSSRNTGKSLTSAKNTPVGPGSIFPDVKPDLEDVDGVLFVSFESKEALDIHAVDGTTDESSSLQASTTNDTGCRARITQLEKELIEDLKSLRHKQVIHPGLQEVGLKLNSVDPTMSIDLKYLGVQLPLAPATSFPFWNLTGTNPVSPDAGFPFVSRTGKTNDFTKIKGWRGKLHSASASRTEGGNSDGSLKNRSAFCSDKLDEYLENEGKLMETSMGFSSNAPTSPVVYQLPTKSTSYVRTLDSVLKKQTTISPSTSYSLKPHSIPTASRKAKSQNKQTTLSGRTKSYKSILPYPVSPKQKHSPVISGDKITKNSSSTISDNQVNNFVMPTLDENIFPKQISLRQAQQQQQQQQQGTRPPGLSKSQVKLMDLEDCALWEGKPRTYITEERADVSLTTLLTAQASLKTKPIHTIIRKQAPPCNNDFCRLGCICSSLALEKRQPAHCRRPDCMFGCTCLKRKVVLVKGGSKTKHIQRKTTHRDPVLYDTLGEETREEEEGIQEEEEQLKEKKKRKKLEYTICETEPEQPVRHYPLWVKVEGEVDPEPVYIPTPSVIEPIKPLLLPQPEVLSATVKGKVLTGIKPARAYTPKLNPMIQEENKDPVYLYFESMMTCARVRVYERKKEEQRQPSPSPSPSPSFQQQNSCHSSPENHGTKEPDSEQQPLKQLICDVEDDSDKSQEKTWKSSCNEGESSSTSYVHQRSPGGPTKLIEIISDCNWEEDRNKILSILSQHINSNMPQSLKVGSFIIELASQRKSRGEKNPPVYSSRVKISMPSCQDQDEMAEKSGSETPDGPLSPGKMDDISPVQADALDSVRERLHGGKGLPFYAGLSPAGKLVAYKRKPSSSTSGLIQVNGKSYPQAKLLLGQMGALHPANRLAAYITGRLRPSVLDLSTLSTVISKVASNAKVAASRKPRTLLPSTSNSKTASSSGSTTSRPGKNPKAFVPAKRPIAARPSPGGVFTQFVMSKVGALQQKIPGVSTPQPLTGPQKFSIRPSPVMVVAPVVSSEPVQVCSPITAAVTTTAPQVFLENATAVTSMTAISDMETKETTPTGATTAGIVEVSETNISTPVTSTQSTATVNLTKTTGITTPVASVAFTTSLVASPSTITLPVASTASTSIVMVTTAASSSMVTTPTSSLGSVPIILSGINGSPPVSQRPETASQIPVATPQISPNTAKRTGPRLLLIPVQQSSPTLRPVPNPQLQGHRMVLQPVRSPSGMNLFRHPNGQIVQLLPLHQIRGSNTQPNLQPAVFRNPGSVMGIRLPAPSKPSETPPSSNSSSAFSVVNPVIQTVGSSSAVNIITQASSLISSGPSFVSQAGTLTLRISPPEPQSFASKTSSETKITYSSGGHSVGTASLIPLQSGSFALLQLPGQKPVPSSILQHVASLQMKKESQNADQKDETKPIIRERETKKALQSEGETIDSEANIIKQNLGTVALEETLNNSLEDGGDPLEEESFTEEDLATVKSSKQSSITESHTDEDYKIVNIEGGTKNYSYKDKLTVTEVRTVSEKASNVTLQSVSKAQLQKLGDVKVEQQKGSDNLEDKSNEFPVIFKEGSKLEFSRSKLRVEQQSNSQPQAKKESGDSRQKDGIRERWRKHPKGPLTQKCIGISRECKNETNKQLIRGTKPHQENSDVCQEQGISDLLGQSGTTENAKVLKTECDSWSRISNPVAFSIVPRRATKGSRGNEHFQGHLLLPGEQLQSKQEKKGGRNSADFTVLDLEEEDEEDENEKTDDSIDEIVDVVSDYHSEEVDDVEKNNCVEYIEDDEEQVDIETIEELSEEINVAHKKATAVHTQSFKQQCRTHIAADEKTAERGRKAPVSLKRKSDYWSDKLQKEAEAFAYYRRTHTANERRRRGEMRDLFEKLKITLGLLHSSKVSKSLILTRAFSEIQGLTDQADKLIGQKNLLTRKRNILIRKVSSLSGKTEEVVLKKLEYIYAKQQALEAQKRKKKMGSDEFDVSPRTSKQQTSSSVDLGQMFINNKRGKPLILSRKRDQATGNISPHDTPHSSANLVMTPQGQVLTLKGPLFSGPVVTVPPALSEADLKPQVVSSTVAQSENDDLFMMPRIVNVTSLATEGSLVDMGGSKYPHEVSDGKPPDHLKDIVRNEDNSLEDLDRTCSKGSHKDGRMALCPTQVFLANKDSGFPQIVDVSSMQEAQEFLPRKTSGSMRGIRYKWKDGEYRAERIKSKDSQSNKLKVKELKDSNIEMELRKVASAIEEAALDPNELLTNLEDEDDTDETLTSLLNEIAFLNQQLNDDTVSLAELPSSVDTEFPEDARRAFISKLPPGNRAAFQVGHLGTGLKELPDIQGESDSISPLLLHLEDDDFSENEKQLVETASEPDVLKIVIDSEIKDSLLSHRKSSDGGKNTSGLRPEPENISSPPVLHMKTGLENNTDTLWRPMPKLAPLGLKVAHPPSDGDGQSLKVMPCLAPVAAKVGSVGHKINLPGNDQAGRDIKVMPTLAPILAKLGNSGVLPSSAGK